MLAYMTTLGAFWLTFYQPSQINNYLKSKPLVDVNYGLLAQIVILISVNYSRFGKSAFQFLGTSSSIYRKLNPNRYYYNKTNQYQSHVIFVMYLL